MTSRTSFRLSISSRRDQPGNSRSSQPTQQGNGTMLNLPFTPCSAHHVPNSRTKASGISRGQLFQGFLYSLLFGNASANCGMQKWPMLTKHVESSMKKDNGTRPRG
jgi:hypothetical protein